MIKKETLYTKTFTQILSFLAKNPLGTFYGREVAHQTGISAGAANQALNTLIKNGLVHREKRGRIYFYSVLMENPIVRQFKIFENVLDLAPLIDKIKGLCERIILFGSCAQGNDTAESDIDLFIQTENPNEVRNRLRTAKFRERLKPILANNLELIRLKRKDKSFWEQISKGILLWEKKK